MSLFRFVKIICPVLPVSLAMSMMLSIAPWRAAQAQVDLGTWKTYATMAEQGAVCGAFADIMAMQELVDAGLGRLWSERRNYAGSVVRRAAELERRTEVDDAAIDDLLARYSMWLLNNLADEENTESISLEARDAARHMIADVCNTLYQQADRAIIAKHPALASCIPAAPLAQAPPDLSPPGLSSPGLSSPDMSLPGFAPSTTPDAMEGASAGCEVNDALLAAVTIKKADQDIADMMLRLREEETRRRQAREEADALQLQMAALKSELDALQIGAEAARDTASRAVEVNMTNNRMRGRIAFLGKEITRLNELVTDMNRVNTRNTELVAKTESLEKRVAELQASLGSAQAEIASLHTPAEFDAVHARVKMLAEELDRTRRERDDAVTAIDTALSKTVSVAAPTHAQASPLPAVATTTATSVEISDGTVSRDSMTLIASDRDTLTTSGNGLKWDAASLAPGEHAEGQPDGPTSNEAFVVQLGTFPSRTSAITEIATLRATFPEQLAASGLYIDADSLIDGRRMYRIMTGSMSAGSASNLCSILWRRMVGCMVKPVP